jgi:hypothetical protein
VRGSEFNLRAEQTADGERSTLKSQQTEAYQVASEQRPSTIEEIFGAPIYIYISQRAIEYAALLADLICSRDPRRLRLSGRLFCLASNPYAIRHRGIAAFAG